MSELADREPLGSEILDFMNEHDLKLYYVKYQLAIQNEFEDFALLAKTEQGALSLAQTFFFDKNHHFGSAEIKNVLSPLDLSEDRGSATSSSFKDIQKFFDAIELRPEILVHGVQRNYDDGPLDFHEIAEILSNHEPQREQGR